MKVEQAVHQGHKVLETLREAVTSKNVTFPVGALKAMKGVVLLHSHKGAAVVGFESGHGIALKVLGHDDDGVPQLSAPVMMKLTKLTFGLQLGYNNVYTLMAVFHTPQLEALVSGVNGTIVGKDFEIAGLPYAHDTKTQNTFHRTSMHTADTAVENPAGKVKIITVSDSFMVFDLSLYGGSLAVDSELMEAAYGKDVSAMDVLGGKVPVPEAFKAELACVTSDLGALSAM